MGRIGRAAAMGVVRSWLSGALSLAYVVAVCITFFFVPLRRWGERPSPDPKELIAPVGLGTFFLLVGPALLAAWAVRRRNARFDALFAPLGLAGFPFALQYRRYDGSFRGRRLQAFVSRGPRVVIEADTAVATRMGVTADAGDTRILASLLGENPIRFADPRFEGLVIFGKEEAWVRRLLSEPAVPALLARILMFEGPLARRQVVLRPGALTLTFQLSTAFLRWIPAPGQARDWSEALTELARIAEGVPGPAKALAPTPLEAGIGSIRGFSPRVNPGVAALVAILVTPLLIAAVAGTAFLAKKLRAPERGPGSRAEAFEVLGSVHRTALGLQVAELGAADLLAGLGTPLREDGAAVHAVALVPPGTLLLAAKNSSGVCDEVTWTFVRPPAILLRDLEDRWGEPALTPAAGASGTVDATFKVRPSQGARWAVTIRARFEGGTGGSVMSLGSARERAR